MVLLLLVLLLLLGLARAAIVFVDSRGSNATQCGGTAATACRSLALGLAAAHAGDTLQLRAGDSFRVDSPLVVRVANLSVAALPTGPRASVVGAHEIDAVFVFADSVMAFDVANVDFALESFDLYSTVIYCNASSLNGSVLARVENVSITQFNSIGPQTTLSSSSPSCRFGHFCAMIQIAPAGDLSVVLRGVAFRSANELYAPFSSHLVHVAVAANRSASIVLDDVSARSVFVDRALFRVECGAGATCSADLTRVAIEDTVVTILDDDAVTVSGDVNSNVAVQFADCLFRNITSNITPGVVLLALSGARSNVTISNCSFVDNTGTFAQATGGVFAKVGGGTDAPPAAMSLTIVDSTFSHRSRGVSAGGSTTPFVRAHFDDSCIDGAVVVRRSLFQNGGGGSLHVRSRLPTCNDPDKHNYRAEAILIEDSTFLNNSADSSGVVWVQSSCQTGNWSLIVRRSAFLHNKAWSFDRATPLTIGINTDQQRGFRAAIDSCTFADNLAGHRAGAILVAQSSVLGALVDPMKLTVTNCTLTDNRLYSEGGGIAQIAIDFALVRLEDTVVTTTSGGGANDDELMMASFGQSPYLPTYNATNSSFQCPPGRSIATRRAPSDTVNDIDNIAIVCSECPLSTYNLNGAELLYSATGLVVPAEPFCLDCPIGSRINCTGDTPGASQGFWARRYGDEPDLTFIKCPKNFCCQSVDGCAAPDACSGNRQGALCGACQPGFTHAFAAKSACVLESVCTPTRVWLGNAAVVAAALVLVLYTSLRASARSDGLIKVLVAFCNLAQVVMSNSLALAPTPTIDGALSNVMHSALSVLSGVFPQSVTVAAFCPLLTMTSFQKMLAPLFAPVSLLALWIVVSLCIVVRQLVISRRQRRRTRDEATRLLGDAEPTESMPTYRIVASLLSLMDFALFIVVGTCVSLLTTVELGGDDAPQCRFWQAGDSECSPGTTAFAVLLLCVMLSTPVALVVWRRFGHKLSPAAEAVYDVYQSAFAPRAQLYYFAIVARRVAVAFVNAFVGDSELRVLLIRSVLVVACALHVYYGSPFASKWVNRLEATSLCALLLASMIQWTSATAEHVDMYVTTSNIQAVMLLFCFFALGAAVAWKVMKAIVVWCGGKRDRTDQTESETETKY